MKIEDTIDEQVPASSPAHPKRKSWLASIGAILVVMLVVGASAAVFAQLGQHHKNQSQSQKQGKSIPPGGNWVQVLNGYALTSLLAADNNPSVLYACAIHTQTGTVAQPGQKGTGNSNNASYAVLRSTDFGAHWQDIGSKANLGNGCELTVNPTNSDDLYAIGTQITNSSNGQTETGVLKHSTDGGQTWSSIQPTLNLPGTHATFVWNVQQLSMVGKALFGLQWLPQSISPGGQQGIATYHTQLYRLVTSVDSGHTWTVVDQQFTAKQQGVTNYAVDPSNASTIYELVSTPWLPVESKSTEPDTVFPPFGINGELYKTTDGGASWQLLLKSLPFGTQLRLARGNPHILYVGGSRVPLPYMAKLPITDNPPYNPYTGIVGSFHLQVSSDAGATWHDVPKLPQTPYVKTWFVSTNGQVYIYSGGLSRGTGVQGGQGTATAGTPIVVTPVTKPQGTPQTASPSTGSLSVVYRPALTPPPSGTASPSASIFRYDPASNTWHEVTKPPAEGILFDVTPANASGDVLWFVGANSGQSALYRYVA